jgi:hypothetical protein
MFIAALSLGSLLFLCFSILPAHASNISATTTDHWAWSDVLGWIDFYVGNTGATTTAQKLQGYASSSAGDISLDCATTRNGDICGQSSYSVTNDGAGNLSGWAWNDTYGWISFDCNNTGGCGEAPYRVLIDSASFTGDFSNYAWNDAIGWISFNCSNHNGCGTSNYKVVTSWVATSTYGTLDSSTFDTSVEGGAQINSVLWQGALPSPVNNASVGFQFAVSDSSSGPWDYAGYDGTPNTWYVTGPGASKAVDLVFHYNARYFRYRVKLTSNQSQTQSPRVDAINVNWSR